MRHFALILLLAGMPVRPAHAHAPACLPSDGSGLRASKDACVTTHIYDVVTVAGGTRFLDTCSPDIPDTACHFAIVTYKADTPFVGDLDHLRGEDIKIRGSVQHHRDHYIMTLNDRRQLQGQPPRFRPDPRLASSFSAEGETPSDAPELKADSHHHGKKLERE